MALTRLTCLLVSGLLAVAASACSTSTPAPPSTPAATTAPSAATAATTITAANFDYGAPISVAPGASVTFVNTDEARHNVTADDKSFSSPTVTKATTTFTAPSKPGRYAFHCTFHPSMHGTLVVS